MQFDNHLIHGLTSRRHWLHGVGACLLGMSTFAGLGLWNHLSADDRLAARIEEAPQTHPLIPAIRMAAESLTELEKHNDYTATLTKFEMLDGKSSTAKFAIKFREDPKSVYLKFVEPDAGCEVIYRPDMYKGNIQYHGVGLVALAGTVSLDPNSEEARDGQRHPITEMGLRHMLHAAATNWLKQTELPGMTVNFYPNAKIGDQECKVIEVKSNKKRKESPFQMTRLYIDAKSNLPVRIQNYDFPARPQDKPLLVEDYFYSSLKMNVSMKDIVFDTKNPQYGY